MKYLILVVFFFSSFVPVSLAQDRKLTEDGHPFLIHTVQKGETLFSISKTYSVEQKELLKANPDLMYNGLQTGQQVKIPVLNKTEQPAVQEQLPAFTDYKVKRNESLHFIAKNFDIEVEDILKYNPEARDGIKKGQILQIPRKNDLERMNVQPAGQVPRDKSAAVHRVSREETLYSISKRYQCSVDTLVKLNPQVKDGLWIGMELKVPLKNVVEHTVAEAAPDDRYFIHTVESGETFWRLEKQYNMSRTELEALNPVLRDGLKSGLKIRIPLENVPDIQVVPVNEQNFEKHLVKKGETLYNVSKSFNVRISELKRVNPVLNYRGLVSGETILIPRPRNTSDVTGTKTEAPVGIQESTSGKATPDESDYAVEVFNKGVAPKCRPDAFASGQNYQVALLLPLYLPANDTVNRIHVTMEEMMQDSALMERVKDVSTLPVDSFRRRVDPVVYPRSENFLHFYEGVLLAADSLKKAGMHIHLHVFDTNQSRHVVDSLIHLRVFNDLDLIIGPVYPELQQQVSDFAAKNHIPMISPLSSSGNFEEKNSFYFKVNPPKEYLIRETANYIGEEYFDKNLIIMQMGEYKHLPEAELVNLIREKFFLSGYNNQTSQVLFHEYNFPAEGYWGLTRILSKDQENVFIIPSETEAQVSVAVTNLNSLAEEYPVTLIGLSNFQRYKSIQPEYFHRTKLNFLSPYFVDYKSETVNRFIRKFRHNFATEPNQFSFQGYDVAFYFMSALYKYGKDFSGCLPSLHVSLTQGEFAFEKVSRDGGYLNKGLFVLEYDPDYQVIMKEVTGIPGEYLSGE